MSKANPGAVICPVCEALNPADYSFCFHCRAVREDMIKPDVFERVKASIDAKEDAVLERIDETRLPLPASAHRESMPPPPPSKTGKK